MLDILIKNGTVVDGTGTPGKKADVAIEKGKIVEIAPKIQSKALETLDATDRLVVPGFIDIQNHSDSYWSIFDSPDQTSLLSQGVTTIVMGNCGASLAPLLSTESIKTIQKWHNLEGVNINWVSMREFLAYLSKMRIGVNTATLVGHATLRRGIVGDQIRQLDGPELGVVSKALTHALDEGALGLSMGLVYAHEVNSSAAELEMLTKLLKPQNKYLNIHLRSEGSQILESLDEAIELATKVQVPLKISHLKIRGKKNWHAFERMMSKLEVAYHQGLDISFDVYPYDTSWSVLYTYLPKWAYEGGRAQILKTINDPTNRRKILDYLRDQGHEFENVVITEAYGNDNFVGKSLRQIGMNQGVSAEEALLNILSATSAQAIIFDHNLSDEHIELLCTSPLSLIATDGAGYSEKHDELVHPRCFGTFPKFLSMVRDKKILKWEAAIRKLTYEPARMLGLKDRGILAPKNVADVVIFDPKTVIDLADYRNPNTLSDGIDIVIVNGKVSYMQKQTMTLNGQVIKR